MFAFETLALPALLNQEVFNMGGISAVRRNPLRPALVRSACVLHADKLRLARLRQGILGHSVWARGDSIGQISLGRSSFNQSINGKRKIIHLCVL